MRNKIPNFRVYVYSRDTMFDVAKIDLVHQIIHYYDFDTIATTSFDDAVLLESTTFKDMNGSEVFDMDIITIDGIDWIVKKDRTAEEEHHKCLCGFHLQLVGTTVIDTVIDIDIERIRTGIRVRSIYERQEVI